MFIRFQGFDRFAKKMYHTDGWPRCTSEINERQIQMTIIESINYSISQPGWRLSIQYTVYKIYKNHELRPIKTVELSALKWTIKSSKFLDSIWYYRHEWLILYILSTQRFTTFILCELFNKPFKDRNNLAPTASGSGCNV